MSFCELRRFLLRFSPHCVSPRRWIATSASCCGKRNFRKFQVFNKRGSIRYKEEIAKNLFPVYDLGVRPTGLQTSCGTVVNQPEMIPELVVPDLQGFQLKPYVSYRVPDVVQSEFTSKNLFDAIYASKIVKDFKEGQLDPTDGAALHPSPEEQMTAEKAWLRARKTGSDIFYKKLPELEEE